MNPLSCPEVFVTVRVMVGAPDKLPVVRVLSALLHVPLDDVASTWKV
jgi:hypothetical protein